MAELHAILSILAYATEQRHWRQQAEVDEATLVSINFMSTLDNLAQHSFTPNWTKPVLT